MATSLDQLRHNLYGFLTIHNVLTLAYCDERGPAACAVWFALTEQMQFIFLSSKRTRHGTALATSGKVAFTVQKDEQQWHNIRGVQGTGRCAPIEDDQRDSAWRTYSTRFPFVIQPFGTIAAALASVTLWSVTPDWLRWIDNTKGFGHKDELVRDTTSGAWILNHL